MLKLKIYIILISLFITKSLICQVDNFYKEPLLDSSGKISSLNNCQHLAHVGVYSVKTVKTSTERNILYPIPKFNEPFVIREASQIIYDSAVHNNILIINEDHERPNHRAYFYSLIDSLRKIGFQTIFIETAYDYNSEKKFSDSMNFKRRISVYSGHYSKESTMGDVFRKLLDVGFNIYGYDDYEADTYDTITIDNKPYLYNKIDKSWGKFCLDSLFYQNWIEYYDPIKRDMVASINIYNIYKKLKNKKIIIYCGHGHGLYSELPFLGNNFRHLTREKTFVIDQSNIIEKYNPEDELMCYNMNSQRKKAFTYLNKNLSLVNEARYYESNSIIQPVDMFVSLPRQKFKNNRPDWAELNGEKRRYNLSIIIQNKVNVSHFLVKVYLEEEYKILLDKSVPVDVVYVKSYPSEKYDLILRPNKKYVVEISSNSKLINRYKFDSK